MACAEPPAGIPVLGIPVLEIPVVAVPLRWWRRPGRPVRVMQPVATLTALERAGMLPLPVPPLADPARLRTLLDRCDGLYLPGGKDVDPARYGAVPPPGAALELMPEQDTFELDLLAWARGNDRPVLGVCRGAQLLAVAAGGSLWTDLPSAAGIDHPGADGSETTHWHDVAITPGTVLHRALATTTARVNSRHHQAVRDPGDGVVVSAVAPDGVVEAVEIAGHPFAVGVQWHPEEMADPVTDALFAAFASASRAAAARIPANPAPARR